MEDKIKEIKVKKKKNNKADSTDNVLLVEDEVDYELTGFDSNKIVEVLREESNIKKDIAIEISHKVQEKIINSGIKTLSTSLIRELVNNELLDMGLLKQLEQQDSYLMPKHSIEDLMFNKSNENSNIVANNPEAVNMAISETILKQYSLNNVFSKEVKEAHLKGRIHLHDLGTPQKVYCFPDNEHVIIKDINNNIKSYSMENLYDSIYKEELEVEEGIFRKKTLGYKIYEKNKFILLNYVTKIKNNNKKMLSIQTLNGKSVTLTENHSMLVKKNTFNMPECKYCKSNNVIRNGNKNIIKNTRAYKCKDCNRQFKSQLETFDTNIIELKAKDVKINNFLIEQNFNTNNFKTQKEVLIKGKIIKFDDDFCYFLGMFVGDGSFNHNDITVTGIENIKNIKQYFIDKEISFGYNEEKKYFRIYEKSFRDFLLKNLSLGYYQYQRQLPNNVFELSLNEQFALINGVIDAEGTLKNFKGNTIKNSSTNINIRLTSKVLLSQMQEILTNNGIKSNLNYVGFYKNSKIKANYPLYRLTFNISEDKKHLFSKSYKISKHIDNNSFIFCDNKVFHDTYLVRNIKEVDYKRDFVYDITTETGLFASNGLLLHNCGAHSIEYIKKYGLDLHNISTKSSPAKHAHTLTGHINTFLASMQAYYAGALGLSYVNISYAPYLVGMTYEEMLKEAQYLVFSLSQNAFSRGGQSIKGCETIYVYNTITQKIEIPTIEEFYNKFDNKNDINKYKAISLNKETGECVLSDIYGAVKHERKNKLVDITCANGIKTSVTEDHSLFSIDKNSKINETNPNSMPEHFLSHINFDINKKIPKIDLLNYVPKEDIDEIEYTNTHIWYKKHKIGIIKRFIDIDDDFALLAGMYVADGGECDNSIEIHIFEGIKMKTIISNLFFNVFGKKASIKKNKVTLSNKLARILFCNLFGNIVYEKQIPSCILFNNKHIVKSFISGYLSGDGWVCKNRIGCSTVSNILAKHLHLAFSKIGCNVRQDIIYPKKNISINNKLVKKSKKQYRLTIGIDNFDKIDFLLKRHNDKKNELLNNFNSHKINNTKNYNQLKYNYNHLKIDIKNVYKSKISLKCYKIKENRLNEIYDKTKKAIKEYLSYSTKINKQNIKEVFEDLYLFDNISKNTLQNTFNRNFCMRDIENDKVFEMAKTIIKNQINLMETLITNIEKSIKLLPLEVISINKSTEQDEYVYDISVREHENFLLGCGLFAHNTLFTDFNLHTGIPESLSCVQAIGQGGEYTGKTYFEYEKESQMFAKAIMEVVMIGDKNGRLFEFPKIDLHITKNSFERENEKELLNFACEVTSKNGSIYFIFDRDAITLSSCCRLRTTLDEKNKQDMLMISNPEHMRYCGFQNVTINLAQAAYRAGKGNIQEAIDDILISMDIAMNAHIQKRKFIQKMFDTKGSPMYNVGQPSCDGFPYIDLNSASYIFGVIGLNECVQFLTEKELHEDDETFKIGIKIITNMFLKTKKFTEKFGLKCVIEESPAESTSRRLAKVDLKEYPISKNYIKGDDLDTYYYTNSIHFNASIDMPITERIEKQSKFHSLIAAGAIIHAFVGENLPSKESIYNLVKKTWDNTNTAQIVISPEFSVCSKCGTMVKGLIDYCENCNSGDVEGIEYYQ